MNINDIGLAPIAVPIPRQGLLTYKVPDNLKGIEPGMRVVVPVGPRKKMIGVVWKVSDPEAFAKEAEALDLKAIEAVLDPAPILSLDYMDFIEKVAYYYFYPIGLVCEEALPSTILSSREALITKILTANLRRPYTPLLSKWLPKRPKILTPSQKQAVDVICHAIKGANFTPICLSGVTGSGKTEVYIQAAQKCVEQGRGVMVLVPEIALASQLVSWFQSQFGDKVGIWHSKIASSQKLKTWQKLKARELMVLVGVRSAIFAPMENLGLVIVDEEHDQSYKQDTGLRYNARDLAILISQSQKATVVLGSATPSLTTFNKALKGDYLLVEMKERALGTPMPHVEIIDLKHKRQQTEQKASAERQPKRLPWWLSSRLFQKMSETFDAHKQVLLFLNRRGFAPFVFCTDCGFSFKCPHCELTLTLHKTMPGLGKGDFLICHSCGLIQKGLPLCPECNGHTIGTKGLGTEQVTESIKELIPEIEVQRFDRDTMASKKRLANTLERFRSGEIQCLVGTQMITKGHDFPGLALVGVIWGDQPLHRPSFNASEETFQLLTQVAGRAGRRKEQGMVVIQTFLPHHYAIELSTTHDYRLFFTKELSKRKVHGYPPHGFLANYIFSGKSREKVKEAATLAKANAIKLAELIQKRYRERIEILGPSPGLRPRFKDRYFWNLLLKGSKRPVLRWVIKEMMAGLPQPKGVRVELDVDPMGL